LPLQITAAQGKVRGVFPGLCHVADVLPKQKELFKKRLEGLPLTKTEQEYYSRSVKKKVVALANAELHGLARKLLEK
jgi:hypothetical protein